MGDWADLNDALASGRLHSHEAFELLYGPSAARYKSSRRDITVSLSLAQVKAYKAIGGAVGLRKALNAVLVNAAKKI